MYNALAAGKPLLALSEAESETSLVINESKCGWQIVPLDGKTLADLADRLSVAPPSVIPSAEHCSALGKEKYSFTNSLVLYQQTLTSVDRDKQC